MLFAVFLVGGAIGAAAMCLGGAHEVILHKPLAQSPRGALGVSSDTAPASLPGTSAPQDPLAVPLTERERRVLARLASLPDLPVDDLPPFEVKSGSPASQETRSVGERSGPDRKVASVMARIQLIRVESGRVFYRSLDEQLHTARAGERLLGVNGRVLAVDAHGADLQIDGQRLHVRADAL